VGRAAHELVAERLGVDENRPGVRKTVQATLDLTRGLGLANLLTDDGPAANGCSTSGLNTLDASMPTI